QRVRGEVGSPPDEGLVDRRSRALGADQERRAAIGRLEGGEQAVLGRCHPSLLQTLRDVDRVLSRQGAIAGPGQLPAGPGPPSRTFSVSPRPVRVLTSRNEVPASTYSRRRTLKRRRRRVAAVRYAVSSGVS